jgi:hypothetical protein
LNSLHRSPWLSLIPSVASQKVICDLNEIQGFSRVPETNSVVIASFVSEAVFR